MAYLRNVRELITVIAVLTTSVAVLGQEAIPCSAKPKDVPQGRLLQKVQPLYPPLAKQARIAGTVELSAVIAKDGSVESLQLINGHPMLVQAAIDAVKQWKYEPYKLCGRYVKVDTKISVAFGLADSAETGTAASSGYAVTAQGQAEQDSPSQRQREEIAKLQAKRAEDKQQAYAKGYDVGEEERGTELIATITGSYPVRVVDGVSNVATRQLISFRLDFPDGYREWMEMVCLHKVLAPSDGSSPIAYPPTQDSCHSFAVGKRYRFMASTHGSSIDYYPTNMKYPVSEFQGWKRCVKTQGECFPLARQPIVAVRRPNGSTER